MHHILHKPLLILNLNQKLNLLAYQKIGGASERRITDAAKAIEQAGSAGEFALGITGQRTSLWKMGATGTIGLEIALNESVERRMLDLEVRALEFIWRREEELARIIDEELTPRRLLEMHLRHLPIRLRPRSAPRIHGAERGILGTDRGVLGTERG